jgi:hypothetical protein
MEHIRDRGKSERQAQQVQTVIAGIIASQTQVEFTTTDFERFTPVVERTDVAQLNNTSRWTDMGEYLEREI